MTVDLIGLLQLGQARFCLELEFAVAGAVSVSAVT
jgi:hypothetical protein